MCFKFLKDFKLIKTKTEVGYPYRRIKIRRKEIRLII